MLGLREVSPGTLLRPGDRITTLDDLGRIKLDFSVPETFLVAISLGAVFMGANTYIGNGPNFMVKAIAEEVGYSMPSFFGFALRALLTLAPIYVAVIVYLAVVG